MAESTKIASGVQELIGRIRDEGVQSGRQEAEKILQKARDEAAKILSDAKAESQAMREKAQTDIEAYRAAALEALKLSARDTVLQLKSKVASSFEVFVRRLVTSATHDEEFIKALVLVLAGHVADEFIKDREVQILIDKAILSGQSDPKLRERGKQTIMALSSDMLREGIQLIPSGEVHGGARVRLVKDQLEIDLSDKALAHMLYQSLLPRFRAILEGIE
ncbi:MAG: ATP synthase subunit E [Deltaproteobacteria bacterium SM23_61]|nr:MAG: ATP synthase subunit E [Deltaproteobacteria bacterium SM23_61]